MIVSAFLSSHDNDCQFLIFKPNNGFMGDIARPLSQHLVVVKWSAIIDCNEAVRTQIGIFYT